MDATTAKTGGSGSKTVAAIDIGVNSLRMVIAEVSSDGRIEVLERLQRAVRLGQDTFSRGRLGSESMRAALAVLRDYKQLLDLYKVELIRAVSTSAVRESSNAELFIDRIFVTTGLHVEVIDTSEESRLTVSAVQQALASAPAIDPRRRTLVADVGGGSTLLTLLEDGEIATSHSLRLGSIRLQEVFATSEESPQRSADLLRQHIANTLSTVEVSLPLDEIETFVAVGGDVRFVAREIGHLTESSDLTTITLADFDKFVTRSERFTAEGLSKHYGILFAEAETLNPALLVYQALLHRTKMREMFVSSASMRDGLLLELARDVTGKEDETLAAGILHSADSLGEKYHVDPEHAHNVAELAVKLFDFMQADHGLNKRYRLLLRVAALLHEVGGYVSSRSHHKHSEYLIANSEIFGLNRMEIQAVSQIARYHRRSNPRTSHLNYMALPRELRVVVNKLAAILRVADALIRGNTQRAAMIRFERNADELIVLLPGGVDFLLEERSLEMKGDMFEEIYGMKIRLEEG